MVCGQTGTTPEVFPYRCLSEIERFFVHCDVEGFVPGSRQPVVREVLGKANAEVASSPLLPSAAVIRVIQGLIDVTYFARFSMEIGPAIAELNKALGLEGLEAFQDGANNCQLRAGDISTVSSKPETPGFSKRALEHRGARTSHLASVGEDDFTDDLQPDQHGARQPNPRSGLQQERPCRPHVPRRDRLPSRRPRGTGWRRIWTQKRVDESSSWIAMTSSEWRSRATSRSQVPRRLHRPVVQMTS